MRKVLCVCMGNTCRSPMMAPLLQAQLGEGYLVESAGTRKEAAGQPANENSVLVMGERGIDLMEHRSRWIGDLDLTQYTHIVCVGDNEARRVIESLPQVTTTIVFTANGERGGVPNPFEQGLLAYRTCLFLLDEVMPKVAKLVRS